MRRTSLQSRLTVAMWVMTALGTLMAALLSASLLIQSHRESIREQLQTAATALITLGISDFSELEDFEKFDLFIGGALQMERIDKVVRIYNSNRRLVFSSVGLDYDQLPGELAERIERPTFLTLEGAQRTYESLVVPYEVRGHRPFYLQLAIPLPRYSQILESLWGESLLLLGLLIGASLVLSRSLARRLLKPVQQVADRLSEMDPLKIEGWEPLPVDPKGEYLRAITDGVNLLAERTREMILQLRKMSRYVAHEMRTPLTVLRGEAETVLSQKEASREEYATVLRSSLEEVQRMSDTVNTVLQLGERARTLPWAQPVSCDLVAWIRENRPEWERALGRTLRVEFPAEETVSVRVDPKLLKRLLDNLIWNVRDHTPAQAGCTVSILSGPGGTLSLCLEDEGPGMAVSRIDSLNVMGGASKAAGVGLHLCCTIAEISGLRLRFSNRPTRGLRVEIGF